MQLLEQSRHTFKKLCNAYGVSDLLFNNEGGAKYDNYDMAVRELYTNAALPLVSSLCDDFNRGLAPAYGTTIINYDISDIPELQESQEHVIKRFSDAPGFKPNDLREAQGYDRDLGPDGEVFFMKQGYISLTEAAMPVDTDLTQLDENNANDYTR
jgi:phage portal protein BeeE